jgi:hypothetical protein
VLNLTANSNLTGVLNFEIPQTNLTIIDTEESSSQSPAMIGIISASVVIALLFFAFIAYKCYFQELYEYKKRQERHSEASEIFDEDNSGFSDASSVRVSTNSQSFAPAMPLFAMKLMGIKKLRITGQISKGGFGYVYKGVYDGRLVAVKRLIVPEKKRDKLKLAAMFSKSHVF